jgi:hypothetical protein
VRAEREACPVSSLIHRTPYYSYLHAYSFYVRTYVLPFHLLHPPVYQSIYCHFWPGQERGQETAVQCGLARPACICSACLSEVNTELSPLSLKDCTLCAYNDTYYVLCFSKVPRPPELLWPVHPVIRGSQQCKQVTRCKIVFSCSLSLSLE